MFGYENRFDSVKSKDNSDFCGYVNKHPQREQCAKRFNPSEENGKPGKLQLAKI